MKLNELCNVTSSKRIFASQYQNSGIPFYRGKEISLLSNNEKIKQELYISEELYQEIKKKYGVPKKDDILMTAVGTIGNCYIVKDENIYFKDGNIIWLKDIDSKKILPKYLYYYLNLNNIKNTINSLLIGSTQKALTIESFKNIEIEVPNIEIQFKIVKLLNVLDNKMKLNTEINNNLHELCNNLYFKLIEQLNENNSSVYEIRDIAKCILGGTPSRAKEEYWKGIINWINSGEVNKFRIIEASEKITELGLNKTSTTLLPKETTVLAITGATLGQVSRLEIEACTNQSVIGIVPNNKILNNYLYLSIINNIKNIILKQTGGAQQHINKNDVETHKLIIPDDYLINEFDLKVSPLLKKISYNCFENESLSQLRDTLLPKLMNSEIDLDNMEI